jgi:uncharacterized protein YndB with AHSA1/START domain
MSPEHQNAHGGNPSPPGGDTPNPPGPGPDRDPPDPARNRPDPTPSPSVGERSQPPDDGDRLVHSPPGPSSSGTGARVIDQEIEVPGTPEEVWEAVASGPGISAWFVPAKVDGGVGGTVELDFGPGYGAETARVTAWDPPRRFVAEVTNEGRPTFATEWLVEARDGGTCVVRLINSGFGDGAEWDAEYDATEAGWRLFLYNLRLYLTHFPGQRCSSVLVNGMAAGPPPKALGELAATLGLPGRAGQGERVAATAPGAPPLAGVVERATDGMLTLVLEEPASGVAFVVAEPGGDGSAHASVYLYLFGDGAAEVAAREEPVWRAWMGRHFPLPEAAASEGAALA